MASLKQKVMNISFYKKSYQKPENYSYDSIHIDTVLNDIKKGTYQKQIEFLRNLTEAKYKKEKRKLYSFTTSAEFPTQRLVGNEKDYNGLMILDIDDEKNVDKLKESICKLNFVYACFVSPSNKGIKVIVKTDNTDPKNHLQYLLKLERIFLAKFGVVLDPSGKDTARLCYVSYDPQLYHNKEAIPFTLHYTKPEHKEAEITDKQEIWKRAVIAVNNKGVYCEPGSYHTFTTNLAGVCNSFGLSKDDAIGFMNEDFCSEFKDPEHHEKNFDKIYKKFTSQHGSIKLTTWTKSKKLPEAKVFQVNEKGATLINEKKPDFRQIKKECIQIWEESETITEKDAALTQIGENLTRLRNSFLQDALLTEITKKTKITKKVLREKIRQAKAIILDEGDNLIVGPDFIREEIMERGFGAVMTPTKNYEIGYYFPKGQGLQHVSNFVMNPLFHLYSKEDNKRLLQIKNIEEEKTIELPSRLMVKASAFKAEMVDYGHFFWRGNDEQLMQVFEDITRGNKMCTELSTFCWHPRGFWVFSDAIHDTEKLQHISKDGIVENKKKSYFLPAFSEHYKDTEQEQDEFESQRYFKYQPSNISLKEYFKLFNDTYCQHQNGMIGIAFLVSSMFRDHIYNVQKFFPHLFLYGESQSGKSQLLWSLSNVFTPNLQPFGLNSGTNPSFSRRLAQGRNCITSFDEYRNDIDMRRFQAIKQGYDGVGRTKALKSNDNRTITEKVWAALCIAGQYLPTIDGNSVLNRSILNQFTISEKDTATIRSHEELKNLETKGLSNIVIDIIKHRKTIEQKVAMESDQIFSKFRNIFSGQQMHVRLIRNYVSILTPIKVLEPVLNLPFSYDELENLAIRKIKAQSDILTKTDPTQEFWEKIYLLIRKRTLKQDEDYTFETLSEVKIKKGQGTQTIKFSEKKRLVFIRFPIFFELYSEQSGKSRSEIVDKGSLSSYLQSRPYYVGSIKSKFFGGSNSSCMVMIHGSPQDDDNPFPIDMDYTIPNNQLGEKAPKFL